MNQVALSINYFSTFFKRALKGSLIGITLVPIFYMVINPNISLSADYLSGMWISIRIGFTVVLINLFFSTILYRILLSWRPDALARLRSGVGFRFGVGLTGMTLGLMVARHSEPFLGSQNFGVQGIMTGLLFGGITYLAFVLFSAFKKVKEQNLKLRAESAEASLAVLKNQLQPHFLFNSLNSLAELIDSNQDHASKMTQKLSDLYREILSASNGQMNRLTDELSIVRKYLELESLRFGARLSYFIKTPEVADSILLPSLILQTLIENAVKHGISNCLDGGTITLDVRADPTGGYKLKIENTSGTPSINKLGTGTGIANTKARLDLIYGDKHQFNLSTVNIITRVEFWISGD